MPAFFIYRKILFVFELRKGFMDKNNIDDENKADIHKDEINQLVEHTVEAACLLYQGNHEAARQKLDLILNGINNCYFTMVNGQEQFERIGIQIPVEVLTAQYHNMAESLQCGDLLKLADTLFYEIKEGLEFFISINQSGSVV
jgi:hypothetical protein